MSVSPYRQGGGDGELTGPMPQHVAWVNTVADPEGNEFCCFSP